jgi:hypothetical protein
MMAREVNHELPRSDTNPTSADLLRMVADPFDQGRIQRDWAYFGIKRFEIGFTADSSSLTLFLDSPFLKPHLLHPSSIALDGWCLGLSILFVRVRPHLFNQLFHLVLLFAHVAISLECAKECLMTNATGTPRTVVISNSQKVRRTNSFY